MAMTPEAKELGLAGENRRQVERPLYLTSGSRVGPATRVNPPVREASNQGPLWDPLADGSIDMIATDHAPHSPEEKTRSDIWTVDCGFPGVETQMPLMLSALAEHEATISDYVRWSAWNPARLWNLASRKGTLQLGRMRIWRW